MLKETHNVINEVNKSIDDLNEVNDMLIALAKQHKPSKVILLFKAIGYVLIGGCAIITGAILATVLGV